MDKECHDLLVAGVIKLNLEGDRALESEEEKSLGSALDPSIVSFARILTEHLDQNKIPNLFGKSSSPTENMLVMMLNGHKL